MIGVVALATEFRTTDHEGGIDSQIYSSVYGLVHSSNYPLSYTVELS